MIRQIDWITAISSIFFKKGYIWNLQNWWSNSLKFKSENYVQIKSIVSTKSWYSSLFEFQGNFSLLSTDFALVIMPVKPSYIELVSGILLCVVACRVLAQSITIYLVARRRKIYASSRVLAKKNIFFDNLSPNF